MGRRRMKALVYPHSAELGGSQLNAIQIAAALQARGHEVVTLLDSGALVSRAEAMGLEHIPLPAPRSRPSLQVARLIARLIRKRGFQVVHGFEWPPMFDACLGVWLAGRGVAVGTIMSMSTPDFLPRGLPLTVATEAIRGAAIAGGYRRVCLLEPPVDTQSDLPTCDSGDFRSRISVDSDEVLIGVICRLAFDLKLEGLLAACDAVSGQAQSGEKVRLVIVGDGPARAQVQARADLVNARLGRNVVVLVGEMSDPRAAYAATDVMIGQGGSALRSMAFAKPLVVVGEDGFSETLTPESAPLFLERGWFGLGPGSLGSGAPALQRALSSLVASPARRSELGRFSRSLVEQRFSLTHAAEIVETFYLRALEGPDAAGVAGADARRSALRLFRYKLARKYRQWTGTAASEDWNARAKIAEVYSSSTGAR